MLKYVLSLLGLVLVAAVGGVVFLFTQIDDSQVMMDRLNPMVEIDDYYTVVNGDGEYIGEDKIFNGEDSYAYTFTAYNEKGEKQTIKMNALKNLRHGAYLKIISKGTNGKSFDEVEAEDIPDNVLEKLKHS